MLWKPAEPIYPRLIKTTIDGLTVEETKQMRKKGLHVPVLTKLGSFAPPSPLRYTGRNNWMTKQLLFHSQEWILCYSCANGPGCLFDR